MNWSILLGCFRPLIRGLSISSLYFLFILSDSIGFRPLIRGLSISSQYLSYLFLHFSRFPSPHPGIINFFQYKSCGHKRQKRFPSPHPGIINFFLICNPDDNQPRSFRPLIRGLSISSWKRRPLFLLNESFRPLIRGLSISSDGDLLNRVKLSYVSVPSSGDYQFLPKLSVSLLQTV